MEESVLVTSTLILLTSNIRGHTNTDQHIHTCYGNKMEKAQVKGQLSVISPGSITEILYKIGEQKQGRLIRSSLLLLIFCGQTMLIIIMLHVKCFVTLLPNLNARS